MRLAKKHIFLFSLLFIIGAAFGQVPDGFGYQAIVRDASGIVVNSGTVDVKVGIISTSASGTLLYEEDHSVVTNSQGLIEIVIGKGTSSGAGTLGSMGSINWSADSHYLNIKIDVGSTGTFVDISTTQLMSIPYAFHARTTDQLYDLSNLTDVDTSGIQIGQTLTWNGTNWVSSNIDSVVYANNSGHAVYSDTANFAYSTNASTADTAQFSFFSDTAIYASTAGSAVYSDSSNYADTAGYALNCINSWDLNGNSLAGTEFIGSINAEDVLFKTNNIERMRVTSSGKIGINTPAPQADFELTGDNGLIFNGVLGAGASQTFTGDRLVWYPKKGHFYAGGGSINLTDGNIGDYSFGAGYNLTVSGDYSTAFGYASLASGIASFAVGFDSKATGDYSFAQGQVSMASGVASVAMGRGADSFGYASVALGYHPTASADFSVAIGNNCWATAEGSYALGYRARSDHIGSFVYSDESASYLYSTADNQFMVRAAGGTRFYSSSTLTSGVVLAAGAGAWATVSDSTKKENIKDIDLDDILNKIAELKVYEWNYLTQDSAIRHIGPMAQDFYASFGFGESDTTITTTDIDGINMAGVKALYEKSIQLEYKAKLYEELEKRYAELKSERDKIYIRLESIERELLIDSAHLKN
ncbi:MAG: hypothetical protein ACI9J3_002540 [Parvicellaceae bacterium]|jgi:hypothetical protein